MTVTGAVWDHPRSRGVYGDCTVGSWRGCGSSPLARGLLMSSLSKTLRFGIIPARAGFTTRWSLPLFLMRDHPRSRGVYHRVEQKGRFTFGSSPLARGLRPQQSSDYPLRGIIPARAGFTNCDTGQIIFMQDHPRSRGVYLEANSLRLWAVGSSPLARGLLGPCRNGHLSTRIIPARAGFT